MTINFEVAPGEQAACTVMEEAAAIWKYYKFDPDRVEELIDYLRIAIEGEKIREYNRENEAHPCRPFTRHYSSRASQRTRYYIPRDEE